MNLYRNTEHFLSSKVSFRKLVLTNGCFDILHIGHLRYLQKSRSLGDFLLVALNSDSSVKKLKGPERPVNSEMIRAEMLSGLQCVDGVIIFNEKTPLNIIRDLKPHILTKGGNYSIETVVGSGFVLSYGGKVEIIPFESGFSTTSIIEKISENNKNTD